MWIVKEDGNAFNDSTGEEIKMNLRPDKIVYVKRDNKVINFFDSVKDAKIFISEFCGFLNNLKPKGEE